MNITDIIQGALASKTTRFAFELLPPLKGDGTRSVFSAIDPLMEFNPAYINVTFHRETLKEDIHPDGSREWHIIRRRPGTVGISAAIRRKYDVEVVPHLICGGWSKYDIEDSLIDMDFLGLHNVLALRGDKRKNETKFVPYAQGHAHAADLVRQIQAMNRGEFIDGEVPDCHHSKFSVGVAGYPEKHFEAPDAESDLHYLKEKVDAGADYIVTQMFFDNAKYFDFVERCRRIGITVPIIPGIKPISMPRHLHILPQTFCISLPEPLRKAIEDCGEDTQAVREVGIEWAIAQGKELKAAGVPIIHFYTMGRTDNIRKIASNVF
ncbi:methylenetetrahydrofolate reductase [NAD(P)H] [uncultured Alistipes sp.]|uniref:methylenetetrahydrofolate reductase [NAD(P)H] n=1 Tax=uncultured Alistipes sp. TaxID=538949 RepID=UPI00262E1584|nr:methylenetetrahydrofolate reductase [NAD(P)H] [uncultured Alistipes sp.]